VWSIEHGTGRDDEINLLIPGGNYGWNPVPGYDQNTPMTNPNVPDAIAAKYSTGDPTLALSGATFVTGSQWGAMNGALVVAALSSAGRGQRLLVFGVNGTTLSAPESPPELVTTYGRLRSVTKGPDGNLYVTTSNGSNDSILRVAPPPPPPAQCTAGAADPTPSGVALSSAGPTTVVRGTDRSAYYTVADSGTFVSLGGKLTQGPAAVSWGGDRTDVFVVGDDRALYHKAGGPGGFWAGWTSLGGVLASAPGGALDPDSGRAVLGVRGSNGVLSERIMTRAGRRLRGPSAPMCRGRVPRMRRRPTAGRLSPSCICSATEQYGFEIPPVRDCSTGI